MKYKGVIEDPRSKAEKLKDYDDRELAFGSVSYLTRKEADKSKTLYPNRDQKSTYSCVCFATVTALYDTEKEILSPAFLYTQRKNKPEEGSYYHNIADMCVEQGVCKESILPTPTKEKGINAVKITKEAREEAQTFKQQSYLWIKEVSIDSIATKLNAGIPVVIGIWSNSKEWSMETPEILDPKLTKEKATVHHAITALPYSGHTYKGKKYFIIQDSAKFGKKTFRYVSEDWVAKRVTLGIYFIDLQVSEPQKLSFKYEWTRNLTIGNEGTDVKLLQRALQELGFFPDNIEPTGFFAGITRQAVKDFQEANANAILAFFGLTKGTGVFADRTRSLLNKISAVL
jgi:hypothetical protein